MPKENTLIKILATILVVMIIALISSLFVQPSGVIFQGISQIVGGYIGGFVALIGVIITIKKQREESDKEWTRQLQLSRDEWRRQDERNREELRIMALPWLDLCSNTACRKQYFSMSDSSELFKKYNYLDDYCVSYDVFQVENTGKDSLILKSIVVESGRGNAKLVPNELHRIVQGKNIQIDIQAHNIILHKAEECELCLLYDDIFGNCYSSKLKSSIDIWGEITLDDNSKHVYLRNKIVGIDNPILQNNIAGCESI